MAVELAEPPKPASVIGPDGALRPGSDVTLPDDALLDAYRLMLLSRTLDERAISLQRQGRLGTYPPAMGQEAVPVGAALAIDPATDWIVPAYRELPALVRHGWPLESILVYYMGNPVGGAPPEGVKALPLQIALASQVPHAVGLAWGLRRQGEDSVVLTFVGDGASSEGDFHEGCNLAGVVRAPVVIFVVNNGYAISTPRVKQTAAETFAARAAGYGIAGDLVDGNDVLAVYEATRQAVERARSGGGATLIEVQTYRLWMHNTADDSTKYVPDGEVEQRTLEDPIPRFAAFLAARGLLQDGDRERLVEEAREQVAQAVQAAEAARPTKSRQLFDHVYAEPPRRLLNQARLWAEAAGEDDPEWLA